MSDDAVVTQRECEIMHKGQDGQLIEIKTTLHSISVKLDEIIEVRTRVTAAEKAIKTNEDTIKKHVDGHGSFIAIALSVLAIIGIGIGVIQYLLK